MIHKNWKILGTVFMKCLWSRKKVMPMENSFLENIMEVALHAATNTRKYPSKNRKSTLKKLQTSLQTGWYLPLYLIFYIQKYIFVSNQTIVLFKKMDGRRDIRAWLADRKNALMAKNSKRDYDEKIFSESKRRKTEDQENEEYEIVCTG